MNDYAVIHASGAQYTVSVGDEIDMFSLAGKKPGDPVEWTDVLLARMDGKLLVGRPAVPSALVKGVVVEQRKGEKIRVATYRAKSRYRRVKGHRDRLTRVKIEGIVMKNE